MTDLSLIIAASPRSGSTHLGRLIRSTGVLGDPQEYLGRDQFSRYTDEVDLVSIEAVHAKVRENTGKNGIFSIKIFPVHISKFVKKTSLHEMFPNPRYVWLQRQDLLGQAISWSIAEQTDTWSITNDRLSEPRVEPRYDLAALLRIIRQISVYHAYWVRYFSFNGIAPLVLTYEDIVRHPVENLKRVAEVCGVDLPPEATIQSDLKKQATSLNDRFRHRFLADMAKRDELYSLETPRHAPRNIRTFLRLIRGQPI